MERLGHLGDVLGLWSLGAVHDCELHLVALVQRAVTIGLNGGIVDEDVLATLMRDKAIAFRRIEPLDRAVNTIIHYFTPLLLKIEIE